MTFRELLAYAAAYLDARGVPSARAEAEVLVKEAAGVSRAWLYAHADAAVSDSEWEKAESFIIRRGNREPTAYIVGHKEFYGLDFRVDPRVLIPRPETEMLVDWGIAAFRRLQAIRPEVVMAEIGTGSGAIAISLAVNLPQATVYAVDASEGALEVARGNCRRHGVEDRVRLLHGDLLRPVRGNVDIILANLPYIKAADYAMLAPEILQFEPALALRGGKAGLSIIRRLLVQAKMRLSRDGMMALEIAWDQGKAVESLAKAAFPGAAIAVRQDLAGLDRMAEIDLAPHRGGESGVSPENPLSEAGLQGTDAT